MPGIIDSDTHISESEAMWSLMDKEMHHRRPVMLKGPEDTLYGPRNAFWLIDGNIFPKPNGKGSFRLITPSGSKLESSRGDIHLACREMTDIPARLKDMDKLGVDTQVVFPTLFLIYLTDDPALEIALCRAYNRFLAQACAQAGRRIRWIVIPPLKSVDESVKELKWAKDNGAVGVFFRGIDANKIPEQFPRLKFGFIEASAGWVPFLLHILKRLFKEKWKFSSDQDMFREYRIFVACEADEDVNYIAQYTGEDHLLIGSDYGHQDPSEERQLVAAMRAREDVPHALTDKIFFDNPRQFYPLN